VKSGLPRKFKPEEAVPQDAYKNGAGTVRKPNILYTLDPLLAGFIVRTLSRPIGADNIWLETRRDFC
jgi:hypothetical protein